MTRNPVVSINYELAFDIGFARSTARMQEVERLRRQSRGAVAEDAVALLETRYAWSVSEHAMHDLKGGSHGWLPYKEVTRQHDCMDEEVEQRRSGCRR